MVAVVEEVISGVKNLLRQRPAEGYREGIQTLSISVSQNQRFRRRVC
jgi:hypothetical protein